MTQLFKKDYLITENDSAKAMGSGGLEVLASPALIAFMENTAFHFLQETLGKDKTSVGIDIHLKHLKASKIGDTITISINAHQKENKKHYFSLEAHSEHNCIGKAEHTRFVVNTSDFINHLNQEN